MEIESVNTPQSQKEKSLTEKEKLINEIRIIKVS